MSNPEMNVQSLPAYDLKSLDHAHIDQQSIGKGGWTPSIMSKADEADYDGRSMRSMAPLNHSGLYSGSTTNAAVIAMKQRRRYRIVALFGAFVLCLALGLGLGFGMATKLGKHGGGAVSTSDLPDPSATNIWSSVAFKWMNSTSSHFFFESTALNVNGRTTIRPAPDPSTKMIQIYILTMWRQPVIQDFVGVDIEEDASGSSLIISTPQILTPTRPFDYPIYNMTVVIVLPVGNFYNWTEWRSSSQSPYKWDLEIDDLSSAGIWFSRFTVAQSKGDVTVQSLTSKAADISVVEGDIAGHFSVPHAKLSLATEYGSINSTWM